MVAHEVYIFTLNLKMLNMSNGSKTNFCYLSNDAICRLKPIDRKIILPRAITLPHFLAYVMEYILL